MSVLPSVLWGQDGEGKPRIGRYNNSRSHGLWSLLLMDSRSQLQSCLSFFSCPSCIGNITPQHHSSSIISIRDDHEFTIHRPEWRYRPEQRSLRHHRCPQASPTAETEVELPRWLRNARPSTFLTPAASSSGIT